MSRFYRPRNVRNFHTFARFPNNQKQGTKRKLEEAEFIKWIKNAQNKLTSEDIVPKLLSEMEAPDTYYKTVKRVCNDLDEICRSVYGDNKVKVHPFGSYITRLAFKGSDVDLFLDFGENFPQPSIEFLNSLQMNIRKSRYFSRSVVIPARVPLIRSIHCTGISCDISFSNSLGVCNSNLIKFILSIDERIKPLIMVLKYLLKKEEIMGAISITTYSLVLLVMYYLQQLKEPLIPSVYHLQNLATTTQMIENWDTSFTTDLSALPKVTNQLSIFELLKGFFEFYSKFEFGLYIISPFAGKVYLRPTFDKPGSLPEEFKCYKNNFETNDSYKFETKAFMCIQEPFFHANNVSRQVIRKSFVEFQKLCGSYVLIWQEESRKADGKNPDSEFLYRILTEEKSNKVKNESICVYNQNSIPLSDCDLEGLTEDLLRRKWFEKVTDIVKEILIKVMKCVVEEVGEPQGKIKKSSSNEKILNCEFYYFDLMTKKRTEAKPSFEFPPDMSEVNQEALISDYLCDTVLKEAQKTPVKFEVRCSLRQKPTCVCFSLDCLDKTKKQKNLSQLIFQFIQLRFPKWIENTT